MRISDWSSDVCSSDLSEVRVHGIDGGDFPPFLLNSLDPPQKGSDLGLIRACGADRVDLRSERGDLAGTGGVGRVCIPLRALVEARPHLFHELVQLMEIDIGEQGRDNHALWCAAIGPLELPVVRSEEHKSELQSLMRISYAVFCLK